MIGLLIVFFLGLFILLGAWIAHQAEHTHAVEQMSIAIAFGTMTTLAVMELIPEAMEHLEGSSSLVLPVCILAGIVSLKLLDLFIPEHDHEHGFEHDCTKENVMHIGIISTIAVILHNTIEGMAVYSLTGESIHMGLMMALGVGLHNIPMGMVIYSTLQQEPKKKKMIFLSLASLSTFFGGIMMILLWNVISDYMIGILIALTLGMLIYIVAFELIPHLMHAKNRVLSLVGTGIGIAVILVSVQLG